MSPQNVTNFHQIFPIFRWFLPIFPTQTLNSYAEEMSKGGSNYEWSWKVFLNTITKHSIVYKNLQYISANCWLLVIMALQLLLN
jgi:hypothetical protein